MFSNPAIAWTVTVILLSSAVYHLLQAIRSRQVKDQINNCFHGLMHILMAGMLWHLAPSTMLVQIALLTAAASWFFLQAIARAEVRILCASSHDRLKCLYHSLTMVGAALMIAMMGGVSTAAYGSALSSGMSHSHDHHAMAAPVKNTTAATVGHSPNLAILLTVFFAAAAVVFIILLLRLRVMKTTGAQAAHRKLTLRKDHGLEALGAAIMALMFATMTA